MDLSKTGAFIAQSRKSKKLTQAELAQKLSVSEKTISKWECGKGFPDTTLILPLCKELNITANELLSAKYLSTEEYRAQAEENLMNLTKSELYKNKLLLSLEWVIALMTVLVMLTFTMLASFLSIAPVWKIILIVFGFAVFFVGIGFALIIEKDAGYYECGSCHHKYLPTFNQVLWSAHIGRTRHMKCPKCGKKSWHKKTLNKN